MTKRIVLGLVLLVWILIPLGMASFKDIASDKTIIGNTTSSDLIVDPGTSSFNDSTTYTFIKNIGDAKGVEMIKVHFKNAFRGAESNIATVDRVWQLSDTDSSQAIANDSTERIFTSGTPLKLKEGYELAIKSIDLDGKRVYLELSKSGNVIDSAMIIPPNSVEGTYAYIRDLDHSEDVKIIKVHFKNAFRGADSNFATVDRVWQVSEINSSQVIIDYSHVKMMITSGAPLRLGEGYELALKSIDIDGNIVYVELSKNGIVVDSTVIIPPNTIEDTYTYTRDFDNSEDVDFIRIHFKNSFRGADFSLATIDRVLQLSDTNFSQVIINNSHEMTITSGAPLKLGDGYELAIRSIDIDGNRVYVELSKSGKVVDSTLITPLNAVEDTYTYTKYLNYSDSVGVIKVHFKNAFRGADSNLASTDQILQVSDTNFSQVIINNSHEMTITSGVPLKLGEGYELAIRSIDINGNKAYVELSKSDEVVDAVVIILPAPILYNKGRALYYQGKYVEAISNFDKAIEIDPEYAAAWIFKGSILDELGKYEEAIKACDRAIEIDPQNELPWNNKGIALRELGRFDDALIAYNEAINLDPNDASAWFGRGYVLNRLGEYPESIEAYEVAIKQNPSDAAAWNNKGVALKNQDKYNEAIKAYDEAVKIDPNYARAWNNKGDALDKLGIYDEAIKSYNIAREIDEDISASMLSIGNEHYDHGEYIAAIRYYDEAIKQDPKDEYAWYNKANALRMLHRNSEAEAAYAKARGLGYSGTMTLMEMTTK